MRHLIGCLLLLAATVAQARDLSLEDALNLARQHSFQLRAAEAQASAAQSSLKAAGAERFPTVNAAAYASYISYVPTLNISIPPIGQLTRDVGVHDNYQTDLRLNLPLYTGGKIGGGIDLARANGDYFNALEKAGREQVDLTARIDYLSLYRADKSLETAKASLKRAQVTSSDVEAMFSAGAADSVDLLEARLAVSNASLVVKNAESNRRSYEIQLAVLLGVPVGESLTLTTVFAEPTETALPTAVAADKPQLKAAEAGVMVGQSSLKLAKADYFPALSAFGGYSVGRPNLDRFNNTWNNYWTFGANLSWSFNIGGKTISKAANARFALEALRQQRDNVSEQLSQGAELAAEQVRLAYERYQSALEQFQIADANYRLAHQELLNGSLSTNRLLEIQAGLDAAQSSLAGAGIDYQIAMTNYYYAIGSNKLAEGK